MSDNTQENTVPARPVKFKSNAPWVLGLIALLFAIPNLMCQLVCKEAVSALDKTTKDVQKASEGLNEVAKRDAKTLGGLADTLDAASRGDVSGALESGKKSLDASVDTMRAATNVMDKAAKQADQSAKSADAKNEKPSADSKSDKSKGMEEFDSFMKGSFALCIVMFFLSFFGKSKLSAITGAAIVVGALVLAGWSLRWLQFLGCLEGVLFLFSGIFSIINLKRAK